MEKETIKKQHYTLTREEAFAIISDLTTLLNSGEDLQEDSKDFIILVEGDDE